MNTSRNWLAIFVVLFGCGPQDRVVAYWDSGVPGAKCGNGTSEPGEECDRGDSVGDCKGNCTMSRCGDGYLNPLVGETCDDGNTMDGDGCSASCTVEPSQVALDSGVPEPVADAQPTPTDVALESILPTGQAINEMMVRWNAVVDEIPAAFNYHWTQFDKFPHPTYLGGSQAAYEGFGSMLLAFFRHGDNFDFLAHNRLFQVRLRYTLKGSVNIFMTLEERTEYFAGAAALPEDRPALKQFQDRMHDPVWAQTCGNGVVEGVERCDDGNNRDGDGCSADCRSIETCGNGIYDLSVGEICDDGNTIDGDGCSADCRTEEICGDGIVSPAVGEVCDDGKNNESGGSSCGSPICRSDCASIRPACP